MPIDPRRQACGKILASHIQADPVYDIRGRTRPRPPTHWGQRRATSSSQKTENATVVRRSQVQTAALGYCLITVPSSRRSTPQPPLS
jgi:hypothetical protein